MQCRVAAALKRYRPRPKPAEYSCSCSRITQWRRRELRRRFSCANRLPGDASLELLRKTFENRSQERFDRIAERTQIDAGDLMANASEHLDVGFEPAIFEKTM